MQPAHVAEEVCGLLVDVIYILQDDLVLLEYIVVSMIPEADDGEGVVLEGMSRIKRAGNVHPLIGKRCSTAIGSIIYMEEEMGVDHD